MADNNNDDRRRRHLRRALKQAAQAAPGGRRSNEGPAEGPGSRTRSRSASVTDDQSRSASVADEPAPAGEPACFQVLENASGVAAEVAAAADAASLAQLGASSMRARAAALGASAQLARRRHGVALPEIAWTTDVARDGLAQRRVALATGAPAPDETPLELLRFLEARDAAERRKGKIFAAFSARHAVFVDGRGAAFACGRAEDGRCGLATPALDRCEAGGSGALLSPTPLRIDARAAFERGASPPASPPPRAAAAPPSPPPEPASPRRKARRGADGRPAEATPTWGPTPPARGAAGRAGALAPPKLRGSATYRVDVEDAAPRRLTAGARRSPPRRKTRARRPAEVTVEHEDRVVAVAAGAGHSIVLSAAGVASCCGRGAPRSPAPALALSFDDLGGSDDDSDESDVSSVSDSASSGDEAPARAWVGRTRSARGRAPMKRARSAGRSPSSARSSLAWAAPVAAVPRALGLGPRTRIVVVSATANHALFVTAGGRALSSGVGAFGRLGHGDEADAPAPRPVRALRHVRVVAAAAGAAHSLFAAAGGDVYACGQGEDGRLGLGRPRDEELGDDASSDDATTRLRRAPPRRASSGRRAPPPSVLPRGRTADRGGDVLAPRRLARVGGARGVRDVVAGAHHSLLVTHAGGVLSCGHNAAGQLGHGSQRSFAPERVPFPGDDRTVIVGAAAGYAHSLFVDATGRAFACGSNARGALGLGDHVDSAYRPARTPPPGSRAARALGAVARVAAGGASSAFRAAAGDGVFVVGANTDGQLGLGHFSDVYVPTARPRL